MKSVAWTEEEVEKLVVRVISHILEFFRGEEIKTLHCWCGSGSVSLSTAPKREAKIKVISV